MLDDVRDESAEDIRLVLVPKSRNIEAELLMESLFRNTDLETRFGLNMNVLDKGVTPRVMNIKEILRAWMDHRQEVLVRRSNHRLEAVLHRLEVLDGYLIVFLDIDKVIRIIRTKDEPKPELSKADTDNLVKDKPLDARNRRITIILEREEPMGIAARYEYLQPVIG